MARFLHPLSAPDIDLNEAIARHTADECVTYKTVDGEPLRLAYFFPDRFDPSAKRDAIVFVHGGGWGGGHVFDDQAQWAGDYLGYLARYFAMKGHIGVSIDYRPALDDGQREGHQLIDLYEDCCDALDAILTRADDCGIDANHLYLLGESAGGHLAGALATFHYDRRYAFRRTFLVNPVVDLRDERWFTRVPRQTRHERLAALDMDERCDFLSPLCQMDEGCDRVVLLHGASDHVVSPIQSEKFYDKMRGMGKDCDLHIIQDTDHAFLLPEYVRDDRACRVSIGIIESYLK